MKRELYLEKVKQHIMALPKGSIFTAPDFSDIANTATVNRILARLGECGLIRRVMRGIYVYPEYNMFLGEYVEPVTDQVARAIARHYGWTIIPYGDTALNLLGLSSQVPAMWIYVSDGNYRKYSYGNVTILFKRGANKDISGLSYKTALIIQALKALGKGNVTGNVIRKLSLSLSEAEKACMLAEGKYVTAWLVEALKKICG